MQTAGAVIVLNEWYMASEQWTEIRATSHEILTAYHAQWPLRSGMPREEWRTRLEVSPRQIEAVQTRLIAEDALREFAISQSARRVNVVKLPTHNPTFTPAQSAACAALLARLQGDPLNPPALDELAVLAERDLIAALVEQATLVRLSDDIVLLAATFAEARTAIVGYLAEHERVTVAEVRDLLHATRRVIVPLLETLDAQHITRRLGDARMLGLNAHPATATPPPKSPETATG